MTGPGAVVVGAGPAGTSAALGLLRSGFRVTVLEQRGAWRDRVCGGLVNPEGVRHLAWLGVLDQVGVRGGVWVRESVVTTSRGGRGTVALVRGGTPAIGVSRHVLEDVLVEAVRARGGSVHFGCRVLDATRAPEGWRVTTRGARALPETRACDVLVNAGGRFAGPPAATPATRRDGWFGWNATFSGVSQPPGTLSMHFHDRGYVGVLTFSDGSTNVCGLSRLAHGSPRAWEAVWGETLDVQHPLAALVAASRRVSEWRGVGPLPFGDDMRASQGALLAGDAAAVGDPYMGEGISRALGTGILLVEAATGRRLPADADRVGRDYRRYWRRRYRRRLLVGRIVRALQRRPLLFDAALRRILGHPTLAHRLLGVCHSVEGLPACRYG